MEAKFYYCSEVMIRMWENYGVVFSKKFCNWFSDNAQSILLQEALLKPSTKVGFSVFHNEWKGPFYEPGIISTLNASISILPDFYDDVKFKWKSKTGKVILTSDEDFDESDLICWMEDLKPEIYWEKVNAHVKNHPFKIKDLGFELEVKGVGTHMGLTIIHKKNLDEDIITSALANEIEQYNSASVNSGRSKGVVHSSHVTHVDGQLEFRVDVGSAGIIFVKKLLKKLNTFSNIEKVIIDL